MKRRRSGEEAKREVKTEEKWPNANGRSALDGRGTGPVGSTDGHRILGGGVFVKRTLKTRRRGPRSMSRGGGGEVEDLEGRGR